MSWNTSLEIVSTVFTCYHILKNGSEMFDMVDQKMHGEAIKYTPLVLNGTCLLIDVVHLTAFQSSNSAVKVGLATASTFAYAVKHYQNGNMSDVRMADTFLTITNNLIAIDRYGPQYLQKISDCISKCFE